MPFTVFRYGNWSRYFPVFLIVVAAVFFCAFSLFLIFQYLSGSEVSANGLYNWSFAFVPVSTRAILVVRSRIGAAELPVPRSLWVVRCLWAPFMGFSGLSRGMVFGRPFLALRSLLGDVRTALCEYDELSHFYGVIDG